MMQPTLHRPVRDRRTPARQSVIEGTLASFPRLARRAAPKPPTLIVVGEVVRLRSRLGSEQPADSLALVA